MKIICFILFLTLFGCYRSAEKLTLQKQEFFPNNANKNLKTNGFYLEDTPDNSRNVFFLYKNGVFLQFYAVKNTDIGDMVNQIRLFDRQQYYKEVQYCWGLFRISSEELEIEKWLPGNGGPYPVEKFSGKILSDSLISIYLMYSKLEGYEIPKLYKFYEYYPKPDSTNIFIK